MRNFLRKWLGIGQDDGPDYSKVDETKDRLIDRLNDDIDSLKGDQEQAEFEADRSKQEARKLKEEVADLKLAKKIETEDISHLVKITEERKDLELDRKALELEREKDVEVQIIKEECATEIKEIRETYAQKQEDTLQEQIENGNKMFTEVMERLPNINGMVDVGLGNARPGVAADAK
jgi:chromosome segregation ATPase